MKTKKTANDSALGAFIARKAEFDEIIAKLQAASDDHFSADPDAIHWGHVGSLAGAVAKLRDVVEFTNA